MGGTEACAVKAILRSVFCKLTNLCVVPSESVRLTCGFGQRHKSMGGQGRKDTRGILINKTNRYEFVCFSSVLLTCGVGQRHKSMGGQGRKDTRSIFIQSLRPRLVEHEIARSTDSVFRG